MTLKKTIVWLIGFGMLALLHAPSAADAVPFNLWMDVPDFIIPLDGQSGTLTVYADGSAPETSGFNVLGSQSFWIGPPGSSGSMTLNLVFSGPPLGNPAFEVTAAYLQMTVDDFDFLPDIVVNKPSLMIELTELAIIDMVNGQPIEPPIDVGGFLPEGVTDTDDVQVVLDPISLIPPLSTLDFTNPFMLSLTLTATATFGPETAAPIYVTNTQESLLVDMSLNVEAVAVPEPGTVFLMGSGMLGLIGWRIRRRFTHGGNRHQSHTRYLSR